MKNAFTLAFCVITLGVLAQVQIDKPIQLSGSGTDARIEGIEDVSANDHAANKIYVDTAIANRAGGSSSTMVFTFTSSTSSFGLGQGSNNEATPITLSTEYVSGTPSSVYFEVAGLPSGVTYKLSPGGGFPSFDGSLIFYVGGAVPFGTYPITVTAVGGVASQVVNISLSVIGDKRVFATFNGFGGGNLGGLSGADTKCNTAASNAGLGGSWKAWLSTPVEDAKDRIVDGVYKKVNGTVVANGKSELLSGNLLSPIDLSEFGTNPPGWPIYTGTLQDGTVATYHCNSWTSSSSGVDARMGSRTSTDGGWTSMADVSSYGGCSNDFRIYCFEQ